MYASFLGILEALHLGILTQPPYRILFVIYLMIRTWRLKVKDIMIESRKERVLGFQGPK